MKRRIVYVAFFLILLFLCACGGKREPYEKKVGGLTYVVNPVEQTITLGKKLYTYSLEGDSVTIQFPDGKTLRGDYSGGNGLAIVGSLDEQISMYSFELFDVLEDEYERKNTYHGPNWLLVLFLLGMGAWNAFSPETSWYVSYGWRYKDAEPSNFALAANRVIGVGLIIIGIIMLFVWK